MRKTSRAKIKEQVRREGERGGGVKMLRRKNQHVRDRVATTYRAKQTLFPPNGHSLPRCTNQGCGKGGESCRRAIVKRELKAMRAKN